MDELIPLPKGESDSWTKEMKRLLNDTVGVPLAKLEQNTDGPKYHHDRCEKTVQMRLYVMSKPQFALVFLVFFLINALFLFVGLAGPPITSTRSRSSLEMNNLTDLVNGPFDVPSPTLSPYCQQLWVITKLILSEGVGGVTFETKFNVSVSVKGQFEDVQKNDLAFDSLFTRNRTALMSCKENTCDEITVAHLGFLAYRQYKFTVKFYGLEKFHQTYNVKDVIFYFKSYNPNFTKLEICFRFIFVILSFLASIWFYQCLQRYAPQIWAMEQKWIAYLLPLLVLYNDPLFPLIFLVNSPIPGIIDALFQATFLCILLLFWLCIYHGIRQSVRRWQQFYLPKFAMVGFIWLAAVTLSTWDRYNSSKDLNYYTEYLDVNSFQSFKIFFFITGCVYILYLAYLIIRAYQELKNLPYFDIRLKFFTILMIFVITVTITTSTLKYGVAPTLEDNFVAQLSTDYGSSAEFLSFYALLNTYIYVMAFVYAPNPDIVADLRFKDPPEFALINEDSEDELYGSDYPPKQQQQQLSKVDDDSDE